MKFHERTCKGQPCSALHSYYCPNCHSSFYVNVSTQYDTGRTLLVSPFYPLCSLSCYTDIHGALGDPNSIYSEENDPDMVSLYNAYANLQSRINLETC